MKMLTVPTYLEVGMRVNNGLRNACEFRYTGDRILAFQSLNYYAKYCNETFQIKL